MPDSKPRVLNDQEREQARQWLDNWRHIGPLLEDERRQRTVVLTDDEAWLVSQGLLTMWEPWMKGDAGQGMLPLHVPFARHKTR